jgi:hypothetical protein
MKTMLAPGHPYLERLGTGIRWEPGVATLYQNGDVLSTASHTTASAWQFWYTLAFADVFPTVEGWWFRSLWTNRVRMSRPEGALDATTIYGYVQYFSEETESGMWTVRDGGDYWDVDVALPPNESQPVNVPLRLALSRLCIGMLEDEILPDVWYDLTSVVRPNELADAFLTMDTNVAALPQRILSLIEAETTDLAVVERPWRITESADLRAAWCELMELRQPTERRGVW